MTDTPTIDAIRLDAFGTRLRVYVRGAGPNWVQVIDEYYDGTGRLLNIVGPEALLAAFTPPMET